MSDELSATIDGHQLAIDLAGLHGMTQPALLLPVVVVAVVVLGVVAVLTRADLRPFLLSALATATFGAAVALLSAPIVVGRLATFVPELQGRISEGSALVGIAGFAVGALLSLVPMAFFTVPRAVAAALAVVSVVAAVAAVAGIAHAQERRRSFVRALQEGFPVPRMVFAGQTDGDELPEVQVGRTRLLAAQNYTQLGVTDRALFAADHRPAPFPATDVGLWNLPEVRATLTATHKGPQQTTATARLGPLRVVAPVSFRAVDDVGPPWLPLVTGTRLAWTRTRGHVGSNQAIAQALQQKRRPKKKPAPPSEDVVVEVVGERVVDGFRTIEVHIVDRGASRTETVVAKDGAYFRQAQQVFAGPACALPFLGHSTCECSARGVERCARFEGEPLGAMLRVGLVVATLGLSEVLGTCDDCGDGREEGLVLLTPLP